MSEPEDPAVADPEPMHLHSPRREPRPTHVRIDRTLCAGFGACRGLAPRELPVSTATYDPATTTDEHAEVPATSAVLDAMSACPTGAIRWVEPTAATDERRSG